MPEIMVVRSERGEVKSVERKQGDLLQVLKQVVTEAIDLWNPESSDFIVIKDMFPISVKLPITPQQYEAYSPYNLRRAGDVAEFDLPVFMISFENEYREDGYIDRGVLVVAPRLDDHVEKAILEIAVAATQEPTEEEEAALEKELPEEVREALEEE